MFFSGCEENERYMVFGKVGGLVMLVVINLSLVLKVVKIYFLFFKYF